LTEGQFQIRSPAAKAAIDFAELTARLKPRPFKPNSKLTRYPEFGSDRFSVQTIVFPHYLR
jgi:hypothetical protein